MAHRAQPGDHSARATARPDQAIGGTGVAGAPGRPRGRRRAARAATVALAALAALALVAGACSSDDEAGAPATTVGGTGAPDLAGAAAIELDGAGPADVTVVPGTQEVTVTGAEPGAPVTLVDADDEPLITLLADDAGQAHTAYVPDEPLTIQTGGENVIPTAAGQSLKPGTYRIAVGEGEGTTVTDAFDVTGVDDHPDPSFYEDKELTGVQVNVVGEPVDGGTVEDGFGYIEARDGTLLSAMVRLPDPAVYGEGPYPTVVEYSGYDPVSNPDAQEPGSRIAQALGYATVGVGMRGSGCSGGAFDVFSPSQQTDGYDIIETVARQPWVKGNRVGMVGLSYSGIAQLYTAATNPPSLAAITAQSVIVDPLLQQWPGGIYNDGFTRQWLAQRDANAEAGGATWVVERAEVDETCAANLELRSQNVDFESFGRSIEFRPPDADERDLRLLVERIDVPTMLTGAFQDEQTGPLFTNMVDHFTSAPVFRARMWNGQHADGYSAMNTEAWYEFLELYVNEEVPEMNELLRIGLPIELGNNFEVTTPDFPPSRLHEEYGDDYDAARAAYEAEPPITVIFESGAGGDELREPGGTFELMFDTWPTPTAVPTTWYLGADESLTDDAPTDGGADAFTFDPEAGEQDFFGPVGYQQTAIEWDMDWTQFPDGTSLSYLSEPFDDDVVLGGPGELVLWIGSEADDADVQVTLTEVTPDGDEVLLQSSYLRISHRAVDEERSEPLRVEHLFTEEATEPIPDGERVEARIGIPSVAAALRSGSRLRLQIATPGRNHGTWLFESPYDEGEVPTHTVGRSAAEPSALTLSVLPDVDVPPERPACGTLRGQVCRAFEPTTNQPAEAG